MKRICFFISSISQAGGTGRVCTAIANKLASLNYEVAILSMYGDDPFFKVYPGVKCVSLFSKKYHFKLFLPYVVGRLRSEVKRIKPDVIVNVDSALFLYSWVSCLGLHIKNVVWEHFNFNVSLNFRARVLARKLAAKYSDAIVTLTKKDSDTWMDKLNCNAPVFSISNPSPFTPVGYDDGSRKPVVLSAGRLTYQKGFDRLLDVWQVVQQQNYLHWELHIVGSGELEQDLKDKIRSSDLDGSVKLLPMSDDMTVHYQCSSIYCMTSRFEGFPMVLLEAQTSGLPIVSYDCETGPSEIIDQSNGFLIKDGNKHAMANALLYLMSDKDVRLRMGKKAYENSFNYDIDIIIQQWIQLFEIHFKNKQQKP